VPDELIAETTTDITAVQSEFYRLSAEVGKLSPKLNPLDDSDEQRAIAEKMLHLQTEQGKLRQQVADYLDGELAEQQADMGKRYVEALSDLEAYPLEEIDHGCRVLANINELRITLHQEVQRCSRIAGRPKPAHPRHSGIHHDYEICDPAKIRAAVLGLGQGAGIGHGQRSTWGAGA